MKMFMQLTLHWFGCYSNQNNPTLLDNVLSEVTPSLTRAVDLTDAVVLAADDTEAKDSFEPCLRIPALPPPR